MKHSSLLATVLLLGAWAVLWPLRAHADDGAEYSDAIRLGIAEFEARNFAEARAHFFRADALQPSARTQRGLGMVEFELKNYPDSIRYLQGALSSKVRPLETDLRAETQRLLERARGYVARISLQVEPESARVFIDGMPVSLTANNVLWLAVGDHILEFVADGRVTEKRSFKVNGGEDTRLEVTLHSLSAPEPIAVRRVEPRKLYRSPWLWTAVGLLVVGAGTGVGVALGRKDTSHEGPVYAGNSGAAVLVAP